MVDPAERKRCLAYVNQIKSPLRLTDWSFEIEEDPAEAGNAAEIEVVYGQYRGIISLGNTWGSKTRDEKRQTIAHELLHCHSDAIHRVLTEMMRGTVSADFGRAVEAAHMYHIEKANEAVALIVAPFLPEYPEGETNAD